MNKFLILILLFVMPNTIYAYSKIYNVVVPVRYFINHVTPLSHIQNNLTKYKQASIVGVSGLGKTQVARMYACENQKIQEFISWEHNGNIVFVSQDSTLLPNITQITPFERRDSITLAQNILGGKEDKLLEFLVKEFSGYPILIVQGAQLLRQIPGLSMTEYKKNATAGKVKLNITLVMNELKPSARQLVSKIALINNKSFSKQFMDIITKSQSILDSDIYDLTKFGLITNIENNKENTIFEMHDVIAQKIVEINGIERNKLNLEQMLQILTRMMPKNIFENYSLRNTKTFFENLEVIISNTQRFNIKSNKLIGFNLMLLTNYLNLKEYYKAKKQVQWFKKNEQKFTLWLMSNTEKATLAGYLGYIGIYYEYGESASKTAIIYYKKSIKMLRDVVGYNSWKYNIMFHMAMSNITLGRLDKAQDYINKIEAMLIQHLVNESERGFVDLVKAKFSYYTGKYSDALLHINNSIKADIVYGLNPNEQVFTTAYMLKSLILNSLGKYKDAYLQAQQLYKMHKSDKDGNHEIFGRIYTQMARSKLGVNRQDIALKYVNKAIDIFLACENRNPKKQKYSEDPELALSYIVQGDIFCKKNNIQEALKSYHKAYKIYHYLYGENSHNVATMSNLYTQASKSACKGKDLTNYQFFGKSQLEEFGIAHPNTQDMLQYCKNLNMELYHKAQ